MILALALACAPCEPLAEAPLTLEQLHLPGPSIGESTFILGPNGRSVLIDVGNDAHTHELKQALEFHLGEARVDTVILTHWHADHVGGLDDLLGDIPIGELVHRGWTDLGEGANRDEAREICEALDGVNEVSLCGARPPDCDLEAPVPTSSCTLPWTLDLGDGATLEIFAASGFTEQGPVMSLGTAESADENARSLVGLLRYGDFSYSFAGDLTGGGKDTPDMESALLQVWPGEPVDLLHLSHHGIRSSTQDAWATALLPEDGETRHALVGSNSGYWSSPAPEVMERLSPRLGDGAVWAPETGRAAEEHPALQVTEAGVLVRISADGRFTVGAREADQVCAAP